MSEELWSLIIMVVVCVGALVIVTVIAILQDRKHRAHMVERMFKRLEDRYKVEDNDHGNTLRRP
jgi:hypothetical protein